MRKTAKETVSIEKTKTTLQICDICGAEAAIPGCQWNPGEYITSEVRVCVVSKQGTSDPYGGEVEEVGFDICPKCFESVLVPALEAKGAKAERKRILF